MARARPGETRVTCPICNLSYLSGNPEDEAIHRQQCRRWFEAGRTLGYTPQPHGEREKARTRGRQLMAEGRSLAERIEGAELIVRAGFDQSLEEAILGGYWRKHPPFDRYVGMVSGWDDLEGTDAWEELKRRHGHVSGEIAPGKSCWTPGDRPGNK